MRGWRAWYKGGRVFSSADSAWADLPEEECLLVMEYLEPPYRERHIDFDWIWLDEGRAIRTVRSHPEWGEWNDPPEGVPAEMLKRGAGTSDEEWERVQDESGEAREWP